MCHIGKKKGKKKDLFNIPQCSQLCHLDYHFTIGFLKRKIRSKRKREKEREGMSGGEKGREEEEERERGRDPCNFLSQNN